MHIGKSQDIHYYVKFLNRRWNSSEHSILSFDVYLMAPSTDIRSLKLLDDPVKVNVKLYYSFGVIPRRLNFMCRRFGTLFSNLIGRVNNKKLIKVKLFLYTS
jgi:hypothetical protein